MTRCPTRAGAGPPSSSTHSVTEMPNHTRAARRAAAVLTCLTALAACGGSRDADPSYAKDGDTGAAAPATQQTLSPNPAMGDSTQGLQDRTQQRMMAGDSGRPSLTTDSASKGTGVNPPPVRPGTKRP